MRYSLNSSVALAALLALLTINPANAQWFGNNPNSRADSKSAAVTANNFATQQSSLRNQISSAVSSGRISPGTATGLFAQLEQANAITQRALASGNLTNNDANTVMAIFSSVGNTIGGGGSFANPYAANPYANPYFNQNLYGNTYNPWF